MQREKKWVLEPSDREMEEGEREKLERKIEGNALEGELVMATPERGRINASLNKIEDSPVFNYINNLSPLEMTRPVRISQSFNSYSFSSIPSVFTSPHVSSNKGTKLLRRHSISGPSKPVCSSENGNKIFSNEAFADVAYKSEEQKVSCHPGGCIGERFNGEKMKNGTPQNKNYGCNGPNESTVTCHDIDAKCVPSEPGGSSSSLVPFGQGGPNSGFSELNSEEGSFDCENFYDAADFLVFESPGNADPFKGFFLKPLDSETRLLLPDKTQDDVFVGVEINESENSILQTSEGQLNAGEAAGTVLACPQATEVSNEVISNEACNLPRGMKRRCLVFDMGGARRKFLNDGSSSSSPMLSERQITSTENQPNPSKAENISSRCIVPGIGLHLNALARTSKDHIANNQETFATPRQLINDISSNAAPDSFANNEETINQSLALTSLERDVGPIDGGLHVTEDAYQLSAYVGSDDLNQNSPKKKKRKVENGGDTEGCKRCNCKKSKCLKLYCECFAAGVYCVEPCSCQDCFNKPIHEETVLATRKQIESRNPLAFAPKVIRTTEFVPETVDDSSSTPASARHKRGCNCKKSGCLKKYCECYQGGVGCSINCRCEGCKNAFGRKEGSHIVLAEAEVEETEKHEKSVVDRNLSKPIIQNNAEPNQDSVLPETPMHPEREPLQHPFASKNKPPRFVSMGSSSSTLYGGQKFGIPAFLQPHPKFEKRVPTNSENEIPEILRSPSNGIKSSSPNSKRVSPPHCNVESSLSPARRTSRKLILQSIPSFPSLKD